MEYLFLIYIIICLVSIVFVFTLWVSDNKLPVYKALMIVWGATLFSVVIQAMAGFNTLLILLALITNFAHSLTLMNLMNAILPLNPPVKKFVFSMGLSYIPAFVLLHLGYPFEVVSFFPAVAAALPLFYSAIKASILLPETLSVSGKWFVACYYGFAFHYLDFPFLRVHLQLAEIGFSIGLFIIFLMAMFSILFICETIISRNAQKEKELLEISLEKSRLDQELVGIKKMMVTLNHNINNLLVVVVTGSELILKTNELDKIYESAKKINKQGKLISEILKKMSYIKKLKETEYADGIVMLDIENSEYEDGV